VTGLPDTEPTRVGIPVSDLAAGLHLAIGILVALHERERTGVGRWVRTSLLETMISMMDLQAARFTVEGDVAKQEGNHHPTLVPMGCFASKDGYVNIAGPSGRLLHRFCDAIGRPDLPTDPRFDTGARRSANRGELNAIVATALRQRTTAEWVEVLNEAGVPCGPVYAMDEVFADAQVQHLDMVALDVIRNPVSMDDVATVRSPAPSSMSSVDEILEEWDADRH
jgi:crotonobetainyl-CoA:carnitine CoA-transferase CaiB-like acyl-CoA transferase